MASVSGRYCAGRLYTRRRGHRHLLAIVLAKAHGLSAVTVATKTKDIKAAVAKARKGGGPALIHVQLEL